MRLLQVMAGAERGGAEGFFERLTTALAHEPWCAQQVVMRAYPERVAHLARAGIPLTTLPFASQYDLWTTYQLGRQIAAFQPEIVLSWMNRAAILCPRSGGWLTRGHRFTHVGRLGGYYDLKYYRNCDHLIGNTRGIVQYLKDEGWPADRAHYVPNFVEAEPGRPLDRSLFETPEGAPLLLALGRLHRNKGFDVLLRAMVEVPEAYLWIGGVGPLEHPLKTLALGLGVAPRVRFLGWRTDMADLMATADIYVCPSRHEPLGNVVLEAWAQGKPVVAMASAGPLELIDEGRNGLLTPLESSTAMSDAIRRYLHDPQLRQACARGGYETYAQNFEKTVILAAYHRFFEAIVSRP